VEVLVRRYEGIDLEDFDGWFVVCRSAYCDGRTALGRLVRRDTWPGGHYMEVQGRVREAYGAVWKVPRRRKPKTKTRETLPGYRPDIGIDREAQTLTTIPVTERVACFNCGRVLSLHSLRRQDLRREMF
jgi:hypothetical protein